MYSSGQIIYDLDKREPVVMRNAWSAKSYPTRHTHFIAPTGRFWKEISEYRVFCPTSIEQAKRLLRENKIQPAPDESQTIALDAPTIDLRRVKHALLKRVSEALKMDLSGHELR